MDNVKNFKREIKERLDGLKIPISEGIEVDIFDKNIKSVTLDFKDGSVVDVKPVFLLR